MSVENGASYNDVVELLNKNKRLRSNSFPCYLVNFVVKRKKKQTSYRLVKKKSKTLQILLWNVHAASNNIGLYVKVTSKKYKKL